MTSDRPTIVDFDPRKTLPTGHSDTDPMAAPTMPSDRPTEPMPEPWLGYREDREAMLPPALDAVKK